MPDLTRGKGLNASGLKYLACLFMLIDHIGVLLLPQYIILRCIGRLAFPIFAFMIANGYVHTSNPKRYLLRLALFAGGVQWFYAQILSVQTINIFATLALGLAAIWLADVLQKRLANRIVSVCGGIVVAAFICVIGEVINVDYGWYGVALIYTAWLFFRHPAGMLLAWGAVNAAFVWIMGLGMILQSLSLLALIPISFYNGERGKSSRWFFYIFYPAHLIALYLIRIWLF